jgi:hypothetical protein
LKLKKEITLNIRENVMAGRLGGYIEDSVKITGICSVRRGFSRFSYSAGVLRRTHCSRLRLIRVRVKKYIGKCFCKLNNALIKYTMK